MDLSHSLSSPANWAAIHEIHENYMPRPEWHWHSRPDEGFNYVNPEGYDYRQADEMPFVEELLPANQFSDDFDLEDLDLLGEYAEDNDLLRVVNLQTTDGLTVSEHVWTRPIPEINRILRSQYRRNRYLEYDPNDAGNKRQEFRNRRRNQRTLDYMGRRSTSELLRNLKPKFN